MNKLLKKTAAFVTAGIMTAASLGAECFAEVTPVQSANVSVRYAANVAKPTYTIKGSPGVRKIRLSTTTEGATIYYTIDGSTPTTSSRVYTNGTLLLIRGDIQIRAIAAVGSSVSDIMTKTFRVATKLGDITGDGNINQNDYSRLKSFLAGSTKYICKDNADCDGSGGLSTKDLAVLAQYLNGEISTLPHAYTAAEDPEGDAPGAPGSSTVISSVNTPSMTIWRTYGGKRIELTSDQSGVTFYYTLDGTTPTTSSYRYTDKIFIDSSRTCKAIAYKNGETSAVQTAAVTVDKTAAVRTDTSNTTTYNSSVNIKLSTTTSDALIYYTLDGTDPKTSSTRSIYNGSLTVNAAYPRVRAYATAKGYAESDVLDVTYKFNGDFTLSGKVWDDTPNATSTADGRYTTGEKGIQGIKAYLINASTGAYVTRNGSYVTTTTLSDGSYSFTGLSTGVSYKVEFEFNGQQYRPYPSVISGGNQALLTSSLPDLYIESTGAYTSTGAKISSAANREAALKDTTFAQTYAITQSSYKAADNTANLALISNSYGQMKLEAGVKGQNSSGIIANGDNLTYTITLTNNSPTPTGSRTLYDTKLGIYIPTSITGVTISSFSSSTGTYLNVTYDGTRNGYQYFTVGSLFNSYGLAAGRSASVTFTGKVSGSTGEKLYTYAEVKSYRFADSLYEIKATPANLTIGKVAETDEAVSPVVSVDYNSGSGGSGGSSSTSGASAILPSTQLLTIKDGASADLTVLVTDISSINAVDIATTNSDLVTITRTSTRSYYTGIEFTYRITANANASKDGRVPVITFKSGGLSRDVTIVLSSS